MVSNSGVNKSSTSNTKGNKSHLPGMEERAKNGLMRDELIQRAAAQASISQGPLPTDDSSQTHDGVLLDDNGLIDQPNSPQSPPSPVMKSIERDDTPMHDAGPVHQTGAGSSLSGHESAPAAGHSQNQYGLSPSAQGAAEPQDSELLATLDPSNDEEENDALVDGWGNLRGSTFVILQYGPRHGARYKLKYRHGYSNDHMNHISQDLRIPQIKVSSANKTWRYTKHNFVGICGVVSEERKNPDKKYKSDPCTWLKIKWKNLRSEDTEKMQHSCSWILRSDFTRFCNGKRAADAKIKEVWRNQEERYHRVLQSDAGRRNEDRSPTPFPLGSAARQSPERQFSSRLSTPAIQTSSPGQHESPPSFNTPMRPGGDSLSNPINIDQAEDPHTLPSSGATMNSNTSATQKRSERAISQRAIRTEAEFIAEWKEKKGWDNLDDTQREACLTVAQAMYDLYRDTITENNQSRGSVDFSIGQRPGAVIAAH